MKKYLTGSWKDKIEEIEVVSETAAFVIAIRTTGRGEKYERRIKKDTRSGKVFDTWDEAKQSLIEDALAAVNSAERTVQYRKDDLSEILSLTQPTPHD